MHLNLNLPSKTVNSWQLSNTNKDVKPMTTTDTRTNILWQTKRNDNNSFINRTDMEALNPLIEEGTHTKTRSVKAYLAHRNGKYINLISF